LCCRGEAESDETNCALHLAIGVCDLDADEMQTGAKMIVAIFIL
jgi:hypothetical protein